MAIPGDLARVQRVRQDPLDLSVAFEAREHGVRVVSEFAVVNRERWVAEEHQHTRVAGVELTRQQRLCALRLRVGAGEPATESTRGTSGAYGRLIAAAMIQMAMTNQRSLTIVRPRAPSGPTDWKTGSIGDSTPSA